MSEFTEGQIARLKENGNGVWWSEVKVQIARIDTRGYDVRILEGSHKGELHYVFEDYLRHDTNRNGANEVASLQGANKGVNE